MREYEHGVTKRRVGAAPAVPRVLRVPLSGVPAKHVAAHYRRADVGEQFLDHHRAFVDLAAFRAVKLAELSELKHPLVKATAADAEWIPHTLVWADNTAVEGH